MDIVTVNFEESLVIDIEGSVVQLVAFRTQEHGNVKFGVQAPRSINVHREEVFQAIQLKKKSTTE